MKVPRIWSGTLLLWQLADCQGFTSVPSVEDFVARREPAITILNDHLYITGGAFSQFVDGEIEIGPLNDTLSLSLRESWSASTVQFKVTEQTAPSFQKAAFWSDPNQQTAYLWGGWASRWRLHTTRELWQFTADDNGGGTWEASSPAIPDQLLRLRRTNAASAAACNGEAFYLGGYVGNNTDYSYEADEKRPTPGLVTYNMETRTWDNVSAAPFFNHYGTSIYGAAACAENLGQNGLFFPIGGHVSADVQDSEIDNGRFLMNPGNVTFYDVGSKTWYWQQASGDIPDERDRHCVAGVQGPNGTYDIYMYGGNDFTKGTENMIKPDLHVLSLPGFVWFKANTSSEPRSSHACIVTNNSQMIVVGGTGAGGANFSIPDVWDQGLGVLDLHSLSWSDQYDANAGDYQPPQAVADWYANGGLDLVEWNSDGVKTLFITSDNNGNDDSSIGSIVGGVVGGVVGVALAAGTIWFCMRRRRRQREAAHAAMEPLPSSDRETAGYDPTVSQNYQHYPIELNNSAAPYQKKQSGMGPGPYEMGVEHKPYDTLSDNGPLELEADNRPQELPAR